MTVLTSNGALAARRFDRTPRLPRSVAGVAVPDVADVANELRADSVEPLSLWAELLSIADDDADVGNVITPEVHPAPAQRPRPLPHPRIVSRAAPVNRWLTLVPTMPRRWPLALVLAVTMLCATVSLVQQTVRSASPAPAQASARSHALAADAARAAWLAP